MVRAEDKPVAIDQEEPRTMPGAWLCFLRDGWWHTIRIRQIQRAANMPSLID
jgi:hypothetical protein